jgi:dTMP kinase
MFITFEGIDKSGKTTQSSILIEQLKKKGYDVLFLREPGGTKISEMVRDILLDSKNSEMFAKTEFLLYSASRAQLVNQIIKPALEQKKAVICDRFYDSSTAYQGFGRGIDMNVIEFINEFAAGIRPDITFFMDVDPEEAQERLNKQNIEKDRLESSGDEFFKKVRNGYFEISKNEPDRLIILNGRLPKEEISKKIWNIIENKINKTLEKI